MTVTSAPLTFDLNIEPPNPILVAPPQQIVRQAPDEHTTATADFLPKQQPIDIIVEFPDGRTRPLVSTTLFVDNQKVGREYCRAVRPFHLGSERLFHQWPAYPQRGSGGQPWIEQNQPGCTGDGHDCQAAVRIIPLPVTQ